MAADFWDMWQGILEIQNYTTRLVFEGSSTLDLKIVPKIDN